MPRTCSGHSWTPPRPPISATLPIWNGRAHWLTHLETWLTTPAATELRDTLHISIRTDTVIAVAGIDARTANSRTGRQVMTAHATVAAMLEVSPKTVQRARRLIEAARFSRTEHRGRYLTTGERAAAREAHGGVQLRIASDRSLSVPVPILVSQNVLLPRRGVVHSSLTSRKSSPSRANARPEPAARATRKAPRTPRARPTLVVQRLAGALAVRLPELGRGHIGALCEVLTRLGVDQPGWTATDLLDLLDLRNTAAGAYSPPVAIQRNPIGLFQHMLADALRTVGTEPPPVRRAAEAAAREVGRRRLAEIRRADAAARRAVVADVDGQVAAAKAEIRRVAADTRRRDRLRPPSAPTVRPTVPTSTGTPGVDNPGTGVRTRGARGISESTAPQGWRTAVGAPTTSTGAAAAPMGERPAGSSTADTVAGRPVAGGAVRRGRLRALLDAARATTPTPPVEPPETTESR